MTTPTTKSSNLRTRTPRRVTPATLLLSQLANNWQSLPVETRGEWDAACAILHNDLAPAQLARMTGYSTYIKLNTVNAGVNNSVLDSPPDFGPISPLPTIGLLASFQPGSGLKLMLTPQGSYPHKLEIWGARPMLPQRAVYTSTSFKKCGYINSLTGAVDVAPVYQTRYRVPTAGYKIALKVVGITASGQKTATLTLIEIAFAPSMEGTETAPQDPAEDPALHLG